MHAWLPSAFNLFVVNLVTTSTYLHTVFENATKLLSDSPHEVTGGDGAD